METFYQIVDLLRLGLGFVLFVVAGWIIIWFLYTSFIEPLWFRYRPSYDRSDLLMTFTMIVIAGLCLIAGYSLVSALGQSALLKTALVAGGVSFLLIFHPD